MARSTMRSIRSALPAPVRSTVVMVANRVSAEEPATLRAAAAIGSRPSSKAVSMPAATDAKARSGTCSAASTAATASGVPTAEYRRTLCNHTSRARSRPVRWPARAADRNIAGRRRGAHTPVPAPTANPTPMSAISHPAAASAVASARAAAPETVRMANGVHPSAVNSSACGSGRGSRKINSAAAPVKEATDAHSRNIRRLPSRREAAPGPTATPSTPPTSG